MDTIKASSQRIYEQIRAAIIDSHRGYMPIYYGWGEGATTAVVRTAKEYDVTLVTGTSESQRVLERETGMKWFTVADLSPLSTRKTPFIADCLSKPQLEQLKEIAADQGRKVIAIIPCPASHAEESYYATLHNGETVNKTGENRGISPIEQIVKHIEELDKDLVSTIPGNPFEQWQVYTALMQAKSTALLALVKAEANEMNKKDVHYILHTEISE